MMWCILKCLFVAFLMTVSGVIGTAVSDIGNPVLSDSNCGQEKWLYLCDPDGVLENDEGKIVLSLK